LFDSHRTCLSRSELASSWICSKKKWQSAAATSSTDSIAGMPGGSRHTKSHWASGSINFVDFKAMQYSCLDVDAQWTIKSANAEMALVQKRVAAEYTNADQRKRSQRR
jgi:hypothetical protein